MIRGPSKLGNEKSPLIRLLEPGAEGLQQVDHSLGKSLFAEDDVQVARRCDLFQDFQFSETHQRRVVGQQLGRTNLTVGARPGCASRPFPRGAR